MPGKHLAANYCAEGCYWPCEHRDSAPREGRWELGPGADDDPEQAVLDEWRLYSIAGIPFSGDVPAYKFCMECGRAFSDSAAHAREHTRRRQLDEAGEPGQRSAGRPGR